MTIKIPCRRLTVITHLSEWYMTVKRFLFIALFAFSPVMSLTRGTAPVPWFEGGQVSGSDPVT